MELYLDVRPIGRGEKGRTACGSAAYRACDKVTDNDGVVHHYSNKRGYVLGGIELPKGASEELRNRQTLWQRHDAKERRKDAQIFREIVVAYPNELSDEACARVTLQLIKPLIELGMCAQWDIHNPHKPNPNEPQNDKSENKHGHIMLTMRELLPDGTFGNKRRDWNRYNGGINLAELLRPEAASLMNEELALIGSSNVVEYKSYAERGINKIPQIKVGVAGNAIANRGDISYRKAMNEVIKRLNAENISYQERLKKLHNARQSLANVGIKDVPKPSLFEQLEASEAMKSICEYEETTYQERLRDHYANIKQYNHQIYDLRKEKTANEKYRRALYTLRNLADVDELDAEQSQQLSWAHGYLKWALRTDRAPAREELDQLIEEARERNTERCIGIYRAEEGKRETLQAIANEKQDEYNRRHGISLIDDETPKPVNFIDK